VALDLLVTGFHLAGLFTVALLWWLHKGALLAPAEGEAAGGDQSGGGSDRVTPPWSWQRRHHPPGPHRSSPGSGSPREPRSPVAARRR
jgi:hypothetical protein